MANKSKKCTEPWKKNAFECYKSINLDSCYLVTIFNKTSIKTSNEERSNELN